MAKQALRGKMKTLLAQISAESREERSKLISAKVIQPRHLLMNQV